MFPYKAGSSYTVEMIQIWSAHRIASVDIQVQMKLLTIVKSSALTNLVH